MLKLRVKSFWKALCRDTRGLTFVEIVVALVVVGFLVGSVPPAMIAIMNAQTRQEEKRIAEILTRNEFEYIKSQPYMWGNTTAPSPPYYHVVPAPIESFIIEVDAMPIDPKTYEPLLPPLGPSDPVDLGIQEITITVYGYHLQSEDPEDLKPVLTTRNYKVAR
jgi:hypothetical protein